MIFPIDQVESGAESLHGRIALATIGVKSAVHESSLPNLWTKRDSIRIHLCMGPKYDPSKARNTRK